MPDDLIPPAALQAAADAIEMRLVADAHYELATDPNTDLARAALEAALPHVWVAWQREAPPIGWQQAATGAKPYDPDTTPVADLSVEEADAFLDTIRSGRTSTASRPEPMTIERLNELDLLALPSADTPVEDLRAALSEAITAIGTLRELLADCRQANNIYLDQLQRAEKPDRG